MNMKVRSSWKLQAIELGKRRLGRHDKSGEMSNEKIFNSEGAQESRYCLSGHSFDPRPCLSNHECESDYGETYIWNRVNTTFNCSLKSELLLHTLIYGTEIDWMSGG